MAGERIIIRPPQEAPCKRACPAGIDVPRYIRCISQGKFDNALAVVLEKTPLPAVCGYVCDHPCESKCNLNNIGTPMAIRALKRFVAEGKTGEKIRRSRVSNPTGRQIAIVGSGPAGLTAAYYLRRFGHSTTIFESQPEPGGMMRYGIPRFYLPESILNEEIDAILDLGIRLQLNSFIDRADKLLCEGYDAVLIGVGAGKARKLPIPGTDLNGVLLGTSLLRDVNGGKRINLKDRVIVVGGGGVACDVARVARRLGASDVHMIFPESERIMPALPEDVEEARKEGIIVNPSRLVRRIIGDNGYVSGVECASLRWAKFDSEGNLHSDIVEASEHILPSDTVVFAIGQQTEPSVVFDISEVAIKKGGTIVVNPVTMQTGHPAIFAAGDAVSGPASVIRAIGMARQAAISIDKYLGGSGVLEESLPEDDRQPIQTPPGIERVKAPLLPVSDRLSNFNLVEQSLTEQAAIEEAKRCLRCDLPIVADMAKCVGCRICQLLCAFKSGRYFSLGNTGITIQTCSPMEWKISFTDLCIDCGVCVRYCPYGALGRH